MLPCNIYCLHAQALSCVWLFCDPMDCGWPDSFVHGISQARILEWIAISSFRGPSWPRDQTCISYICHIGRQILYLLSHLGGPRSPWNNRLCASPSGLLCFNAVSCGTHNSVFERIPLLYLRVLCVSWGPSSSWTTVRCPAGCYIFLLSCSQSLICFLADNRCLILAEWIESRMKNAYPEGENLLLFFMFWDDICSLASVCSCLLTTECILQEERNWCDLFILSASMSSITSQAVGTE